MLTRQPRSTPSQGKAESRPDQPVSRPHGSESASRPASPFPFGWFPSLTDPDRPVARPHCSGSPGYPDSPSGSPGWPDSPSGSPDYPDSPAPRAARRCQTPAENSGFPAFPSPPGEPLGYKSEDTLSLNRKRSLFIVTVSLCQYWTIFAPAPILRRGRQSSSALSGIKL
jgi:hypothetical protein